MTKWRGAVTLGSIAFAIGVALALCCYRYVGDRKWRFSHPFSITNIKEGQHLSGDAGVIVYVTGRITWVELAVDGETYSSQNTNTYGSDHRAMFDLPTYLYKNGRHTLQIKAYSTIYDQRHVVFQNAKQPG